MQRHSHSRRVPEFSMQTCCLDTHIMYDVEMYMDANGVQEDHHNVLMRRSLLDVHIGLFQRFYHSKTPPIAAAQKLSKGFL